VTGRPRLARTAAALLVVLAALTGCASAAAPGDGANAQVSTPAGTRGYHGAWLERPYALPRQPFTASTGGPYVPATDATAPVTLVFFGYTHCPDVCNVVLANVASALRRADPPVRERVRLLFVTTDPERDTPAVMKAYLDRFDPSYVGLTAPLPTIEKAARALGVAYTGKDKKAVGGGYEVGHGAQVIGFTRGEGRLVWMPDTTVADLRADLTRLARG
jgi:protein SCO1